jgi:sortase A
VTFWRLLRGLGRVLFTAGALILLFVAYQLWGTGVHADIAQNKLENDFEVVETNPEVDQTQQLAEELLARTGEPLPEDQLLPALTNGAPVGRIQIPAIGVDWIIVEGVGLDQLKDGPGHYQGTPYPGQAGNVAIAGHRTTYGQPFHNLDQLGEGDQITITTPQGEFVYEYRKTEIVAPSQVEVLDDFGDNRLTLTACHPKYSARERIVVTAALTNPNPAPVIYQESEVQVVALDDADLSGQDADRMPAILWALACAAIWIAAFLVGRVWRKWPSYLIGLPFFAVALYAFFENFSRLLPSNY